MTTIELLNTIAGAAIGLVIAAVVIWHAGRGS